MTVRGTVADYGQMTGKQEVNHWCGLVCRITSGWSTIRPETQLRLPTSRFQARMATVCHRGSGFGGCV